MTYAIRNSIIIGTLLIVVIFANFFVINNSKKELSIQTRELEQVVKKLTDLEKVNPDLQKEKEIIAQHDRFQREALKKTKFILQYDDASLAYDYLTNITARYCPKLNFDFSYGGANSGEDINYNIYSLNGTTDIKSLFTFIYQIEEQSPLYIIDNIDIGEEHKREKHTDEDKTLVFNITLYAYYDKNGMPYADLPFMDLEYKTIRKNPFKFVIHDPIEDKTQLAYISLNNAKLIGMTTDNIILQDKNGKVSLLDIGDKVAYGYLQKINWDEQFALFKIDRIGILEDIKLYIEKD